MKTIFAVPPILSKKGQAQATQGRQWQYFSDPTYIFPIMPANFLTMLTSEPNNEALLVDCVAEELTEIDFGNILLQMKPDYIVFEANTMLVRRYWEVINGIKNHMPNIKIILCGEHVTVCEEECKNNCKADFFIKSGRWFYDAFKIITGKEWPKDKPLPHINREISRWFNYAYKNGNFKHLPATYTQFSLDCWYRPKQPCTFCSWVNYFEHTTTRTVEDCLDEVEGLINFGFKEFFDDSGTFPVGKWLHDFCNGMIERGYNKHIKFGINMRFKALQPEDFRLLSEAGCRFILWGFESANQNTLDTLHKGYDIKSVSPNLIAARMNGIWNHLTVMMGYPWETLEEEKNTFKMVKWLLVNDWATSMQATIFMPYPGTKSFKDCKEQGLLIEEDWNKWDMTEQIVKLKYPFKEALKLQKAYYDISYNPRFIWNKLSKIRNWEDVKFYSRLGKKVINRFSNLFDSTGVPVG